MNGLIKVNFDTQTVSARDLHENVGSTERFSAWFNRQLQYGFIENEDYTSVKVLTEVQNNGGIQEKDLQDYNLSVDMAKQICMIQKNEKAKKIRQYFLDLEKAWNTPEQIFARALKMAETKISELKQHTCVLETELKANKQIIGELKPKADYTDIILNNKGLVTITQIAKDYGMSGKALNAILYTLGVQYKQSDQWLLYSKYHSEGYTHSKTIDIAHTDGTPDVRMSTKWTQKGRLFLYGLLKTNGYLPVIEQSQTA